MTQKKMKIDVNTFSSPLTRSQDNFTVYCDCMFTMKSLQGGQTH